MISGPDKDRSTCRSHLCAYPARAVGAVAGWRAEGEAVWTTGDADLKLSRHESLSEFRLRFLPTGVCWWSALHRCPWREPCRWPPGIRIDNETWALARVALARTCLAACYLVQLPSTKKWGRAASLANGTSGLSGLSSAECPTVHTHSICTLWVSTHVLYDTVSVGRGNAFATRS